MEAWPRPGPSRELGYLSRETAPWVPGLQLMMQELQELQELHSAGSAVPSAMPAAHTRVHSLTLAGVVWGRSGSCQCCGELGTGILATCYLWPPSPQGAFMHESQQMPMGKRDLAVGDASGAKLVLRAEPRHSPPHRQLARALRGKWLFFAPSPPPRLARPMQSRKAGGEGVLAFGCPQAGVGV